MIVNLNGQNFDLKRIEINFAPVDENGNPQSSDGVHFDTGRGSMVLTAQELDTMPQERTAALVDAFLGAYGALENSGRTEGGE